MKILEETNRIIMPSYWAIDLRLFKAWQNTGYHGPDSVLAPALTYKLRLAMGQKLGQTASAGLGNCHGESQPFWNCIAPKHSMREHDQCGGCWWPGNLVWWSHYTTGWCNLGQWSGTIDKTGLCTHHIAWVYQCCRKAKSWVAQQTTHDWWLGGPSQFWVVRQ